MALHDGYDEYREDAMSSSTAQESARLLMPGNLLQNFDEMTAAMEACRLWLEASGATFATADVIAMAAAIRQSHALGSISNVNEEMLAGIADHLRGLRDQIDERGQAGEKTRARI